MKKKITRKLMALVMTFTLVAGMCMTPASEVSAKTTTNDWTYANQIGAASKMYYLFNVKSIKIESGKMKVSRGKTTVLYGHINEMIVSGDPSGFEVSWGDEVEKSKLSLKIADDLKIVRGYYEDSETYHETTISKKKFNKIYKKDYSIYKYGEVAVCLNEDNEVYEIYIYDGSGNGTDLF